MRIRLKGRKVLLSLVPVQNFENVEAYGTFLAPEVLTCLMPFQGDNHDICSIYFMWVCPSSEALSINLIHTFFPKIFITWRCTIHTLLAPEEPV
jgi:hypothetical protein